MLCVKISPARWIEVRIKKDIESSLHRKYQNGWNCVRHTTTLGFARHFTNIGAQEQQQHRQKRRYSMSSSREKNENERTNKKSNSSSSSSRQKQQQPNKPSSHATTIAYRIYTRHLHIAIMVDTKVLLEWCTSCNDDGILHATLEKGSIEMRQIRQRQCKKKRWHGSFRSASAFCAETHFTLFRITYGMAVCLGIFQ